MLTRTSFALVGAYIADCLNSASQDPDKIIDGKVAVNIRQRDIVQMLEYNGHGDDDSAAHEIHFAVMRAIPIAARLINADDEGPGHFDWDYRPEIGGQATYTFNASASLFSSPEPVMVDGADAVAADGLREALRASLEREQGLRDTLSRIFQNAQSINLMPDIYILRREDVDTARDALLPEIPY